MTRRSFLAGSGAAGAGLLILPPGSALGYRANEQLGIGIVGCGGRGRWFVQTMPRIGHRVVGLCDVNEQRAAESFAELPDAPRFHDYRRMLDELDRQLDAVIVATPDHSHAPCSILAMNHGKHVLCEKPLTHNVAEAREMVRAAADAGVATQMGNQGTATDAFREGVEWVRSGALGEVSEVHVWKDSGGPGPRPMPEGAHEVPAYLRWDEWLGPAPSRPYHPDWMRWHGWRDFGTGQLGNWGSHSSNMAFLALEIDRLWRHEGPAEERLIEVEAEVAEVTPYSFPRWERVRLEVPRRGADLPPLTFWWHNGAPGSRARIEERLGERLDWGDAGERQWRDHAGCLIVGTRGMLHADGHNSRYRLLPAEWADSATPPSPTLPRSGSHEREWLDACRGGPRPMSQFGYSGRLTEFLLLVNVATQFDGPLEYDPVAGRVVNRPEANAALARQPREGWNF